MYISWKRLHLDFTPHIVFSTNIVSEESPEPQFPVLQEGMSFLISQVTLKLK